MKMQMTLFIGVIETKYENPRKGFEALFKKQWLGFSSLLGFIQTYFAISRAVGVQFLILFISLDSSFH